MKDKFFCEVVQENDPVIKFRIVNANMLDEALNILREQYTNIKEWVVKDLATGIRYTDKD